MKSVFVFAFIAISVVSFAQNELAMPFHEAGEDAMNKGMYDKAIKNFSLAIKEDPTSTWSFIYRGITYDRSLDKNSAIKDFTSAIELAPEQPISYEYRGEIYYQREDYEKAIEDFSNALKYNTDLAELWYKRGQCYLLTKMLDESIADFSKVIEMKPDHYLAFNSRGWAYYRKGEFKTALEDLTEAKKIGTESEQYPIIIQRYNKAEFSAQ